MKDGKGAGPLAGVKVLEITTMVAGPIGGLMLADLGATVTKIETMAGDPLRHVQPQHKGMCAHFFAVNRHKRSIQIDLKTDEGRAIAQKLAAQCDVLLVNSRPSVMGRLGLGYDELSKTNPGLIYVSISGFGDDGPYVNRPAFDQVIQALTGAMQLQNPEGEPKPLRSMFVDKFAGAVAVSAVCAALYHRERNGGRGQYISAPLMKTFSFLSLVDNLHNHAFVESDNKTPIINITRPFRSADGVFMGHIQTDEQFARVCGVLGVEHLVGDERFKSAVRRVANYDLMWRELEKGAMKFSSAELEALALNEGLPLAKVNTVDEFLDDPQCRHLHCVEQFDTEEFGEVRVAAHPVTFSASPADVRGVAPWPGQHSDGVLSELGFGDDRIAGLRNAGVIR